MIVPINQINKHHCIETRELMDKHMSYDKEKMIIDIDEANEGNKEKK